MSKHSNLAPFLRPGATVLNGSGARVGNTYSYRVDATTYGANTPVNGDVWADGRLVSDFTAVPLGNSGYVELTVTTASDDAGAIGTSAVEKTVYSLTWRPVSKPLEVHPEFSSGGSQELDETARKCIIGWRAEQDPALKAAFKFRPLDSNGEPGAEVTIASESPAARIYLGYVAGGTEEYTDYFPIWRKRSIYRGSTTPPAGGCGQKEAPAGSPPSGYEWVKSADNVESYGNGTRWRRDEEWEGCFEVLVDSTTLY